MNVPASRVRSRSGRTVVAHSNKNVRKELRAVTSNGSRAFSASIGRMANIPQAPTESRRRRGFLPIGTTRPTVSR